MCYLITEQVNVIVEYRSSFLSLSLKDKSKEKIILKYHMVELYQFSIQI